MKIEDAVWLMTERGSSHSGKNVHIERGSSNRADDEDDDDDNGDE